MSDWKPVSGGDKQVQALASVLRGLLSDSSTELVDVDLNAEENVRITYGPIPTPGAVFGEFPMGYCVVWHGTADSSMPTGNSPWLIQRGVLPEVGKVMIWVVFGTREVNRLCSEVWGLELQLPATEN